MKKLLNFISIYFIAITANASLIEHDYLAEGDGLLTYVNDLGLEILDASLTSYTHETMKEKLATDTLYDGFRFMSSAELFVVFDWFVDEDLSTSFYLQEDFTEEESAKIDLFLELVGVGGFFNTCDHPEGCETLSFDEYQDVLIDGNGHILSSQGIFWLDNDAFDWGTQLLVREYSVSEPFAASLLILSLLTFVQKRRAIT